VKVHYCKNDNRVGFNPIDYTMRKTIEPASSGMARDLWLCVWVRENSMRGLFEFSKELTVRR